MSKAPEKIFLSVEKGEDWEYAMWTQKGPEEQKFSELDEHEEYIRKDALLEWANEKLVKSYDGSTDFDYGMAYAYTCLIEKLEEL